MNYENIYARCVCGNMWGDVAPAGTKEIECPECQMLCAPIGLAAKEERFACDCGSDMFHVTPECVCCVVCGAKYAHKRNDSPGNLKIVV